jgi:hypothetical protein
MAMAAVQWHGTPDEAEALASAARTNCNCTFGGYSGAPLTTCPAHEMMLNQTALDHLLYVRRRLATHEPGAKNRVVRAPDREGKG